MQDASLQESMGPIVDRTRENLVSTDNGIIMARHRLLRAVKALIDKGEAPPGRRSRAPAGALRGRRAAARPGLQGCRPRSPDGAARHRAGLGLRRATTGRTTRTAQMSVDKGMSESARMATAAEARFRIDAPNASPRASRSLPSTRRARALVKHLARGPWRGATFFTASAFAGSRRPRARLLDAGLAQRSRRAHQGPDRRSRQRRPRRHGGDGGRERPGRGADRRGLQPQADQYHRPDPRRRVGYRRDAVEDVGADATVVADARHRQRRGLYRGHADRACAPDVRNDSAPYRRHRRRAGRRIRCHRGQAPRPAAAE